AFACVGASLAALAGAGVAAGIALGRRRQFHGHVSTQQVGGHLLRVDPHRELQRVVADVLCEGGVRIEDVVTRDPADLDAVGGGYALLADLVLGEFFKMFGAELPWPPARHVETKECDPTVEESHRVILPGTPPAEGQKTPVSRGSAWGGSAA